MLAAISPFFTVAFDASRNYMKGNSDAMKNGVAEQAQ